MRREGAKSTFKFYVSDRMWDSSPKHFVAKNCLKDYFWSQMLLFSARRGRPRHERSQHLRIQIVRYGLFWMGADDRVSEKIQTRAGHIYRVTLILWLSWFARTSRLTRAYAMPADGRSPRSAGIAYARARGDVCANQESHSINVTR